MIIQHIVHESMANGLTRCIILALFPVKLPIFLYLIPRAANAVFVFAARERKRGGGFVYDGLCGWRLFRDTRATAY